MMDKNTLSEFSKEMNKNALFPIKLTKMIGKLTGARAAIKGSKRQIREASRKVTKGRLAGGKDFNAAGKFDEVLEGIKTRDLSKAERIFNPEKGGASLLGGNFISRHKGKLLIGGAAAGGLILANSSNEKDVQRRRMLVSNRNFRVPRRVYYQ